MKNSLKQLLRPPIKAALFLLLLTAATLVLVLSAGLFLETSRQIGEVESSFTTVARVEQVPVATDNTVWWDNPCWGRRTDETELWDERINMEDLQFDGANYVTAPEFRPYCMTEQPGWKRTVNADRLRDQWIHIFEFTALEDSDELGAADVRVERILLRQNNLAEDLGAAPPKEGDTVFFCQCGGTYQEKEGSVTPLKQGKRYIAAVQLEYDCGYHEVQNDIVGGNEGLHWTTNLEYIVKKAPHSTQCDPGGEETENDHFPVWKTAPGTFTVWKK